MIITLMTVAFISTGTSVFADDQVTQGPGSRGKMMKKDGHGRNWDRGYSNLSEEDVKKLKEAREAYIKDTQDLRLDIHQKQLELRSELAKKDIDVKRATKLQKEISDLNAEMDMKRLTHRIKIKEINPYIGMQMGKSRGADKQGGGKRMF